jgi:hypothetical protein
MHMSQHIQMKHKKQMLQQHQNYSENISNHFIEHRIAPGEASQITLCNVIYHQMKHLKTLHATSRDTNRNISKHFIHTSGREQQVVRSPKARPREASSTRGGAALPEVRAGHD